MRTIPLLDPFTILFFGFLLWLIATNIVFLVELVRTGRIDLKRARARVLLGACGALFIVSIVLVPSQTVVPRMVILSPFLIEFVFFLFFLVAEIVVWGRISKPRLMVFSGLVAIQVLNLTGFCWTELRFFSDREILARAYQGYYGWRGLPNEEIQEKMAAYIRANPKCCEVRKLSLVASDWERPLGSCWYTVGVMNLESKSGQFTVVENVFVNACDDRFERERCGSPYC